MGEKQPDQWKLVIETRLVGLTASKRKNKISI